jgi:hypothetical protein
MKIRALTALCALSFCVITSYAQTTVNYQSLPASAVLGPLGSGAVGQPIFNAPTGNPVILNDFTFYLENTGGTDENFEFSLYAANGGPTDTIVWTSPEQQITASDTSFTPFTVHPNYTLSGAFTYVMFITELGQNGGNYGSVLFDTSPGGPDPDQYGLFVYNNSTDPSGYTVDANWSAFIGLGMTYNADFSVPDTGSSILLMSLGLGGIAALGRRFRSA